MDSAAQQNQVVEPFSDAEQQHRSATLGMWTFLATEILFFGGLFAAYTIYRLFHREAFHEASQHLIMPLGATNTAVLLISSVAMAFAVRACGHKAKGSTVFFLLVTAVLGTVFLGIKGLEYAIDYRERLIPGSAFDPARFHAPGPSELFYVLYFCMTGLHAVHLTIGVLLMLALAYRVIRAPAERLPYNWVEMSGLYWHLVDVIWVFLFPLLYMVE